MEYVKFGELYSIPSSNGVSRPSAVRGQGYKMINMGELFSNDIIYDIPMERVELSSKEKEKYFVQENDLLFARQSLVASGAGKCSIVKQLSEETTFESHLIRVRLDENKCNPWYYYYLFQLPYNPIKTIVNQCAQAGIRGKELVKVKVPLPTKDEQNKIADMLKRYDELIENNNQRIKILEQMVENLYKEWFVRFRFPGHESAIFENGFPKDWMQIRLGEKMTFVRGKSYSSTDIEDGENILLSMNNIRPYGGFVRDFTRVYGGKYQEKHLIKYGDVIMSITDMTQDRRIIGYVAMFDSDRTDCIMSTHLMKIKTDINHLFVLGFFNASGLSKMIAEFATGANVLGLTDSILKRIKATLPPYELIEQYGKLVEPYYDIIATIKNQNENLVKQRDMLLPRLMSGKLEIKESQKKVIEFKPKKTFIEFKNSFAAAARKDSGLTEQDMEELYKAYCDDSCDE